MKRIIALIVTIIFAISTSASTFAVTSEQRMKDEDIRQYALNFMRDSQEKENLEISDFLPMHDVDGKITGYYITFSEGKLEAGYLILSLLTTECPIVEFSFQGSGTLEQAIEKKEMNSLNVIYTGPDSLYLEQKNGSLYSVYDQSEVSKKELSSLVSIEESSSEKSQSVSVYDGIIDWADAKVKNSDTHKIMNFGAGSDYWLMTDFDDGGVCYPTAATNILWYWGKMRGRNSVKSAVSQTTYNKTTATKIFNKLYAGMLTTQKSTFDFMILSGFEYFFGTPAKPGGTWNTKKIPKNSSFSSYVNELEAACPIFLVLKERNSLFSDGHGVYAFGYATNSNNVDYLFVMDGWNSYGRFVKFDYYPRIFGYKIWVK